ncbi:hypothetical protein Tco_1236141 [Tanacetum coccineum]
MWLVKAKRTLGKDFSNPLMADSLPKTIWLSIHMFYNEELAIPGQTTTEFKDLSSTEEIFSADVSKQGRIKMNKLFYCYTNLAAEAQQRSKRAEDDKEEFGYILLVFMELIVKNLDD